ncbi:MAG: glycosyltransferase family 2 protein [Paracoccus sp. (in: a-proteobacteria)]|nr:glycosyltransferase family 2 protein [Paracoccus sp. (in: a-proteobacteria)]
MRTIITTMRNEAPFILEWLAYHRAIGFDRFLVFSNDCEDGTELMLDRLQAMGLLRHIPNPRRGNAPVQWTAMRRARNQRIVKESEWVLVSDVDEFLNVRIGAGMLDDLIGLDPQADGFRIAWRMFGSNGITTFEDRPVIEQFTAAAPDRLIWPWRAVQFKTLYRHGAGDLAPGVHRPKPLDPTRRLHWIDDNGQPAPDVPGTVLPTTAQRYRVVQLNHYALGSVENFLVKVARGKPNHMNDAIDLGYWLDRNFNEQPETSIHRHLAATRAGMDDLMQDADLARLHQQGVAWRQARIAALMLQSDYFYLYARILQAAPTHALPLAAQLTLMRQLYAMRRAQIAERAAAGNRSDPDSPTED